MSERGTTQYGRDFGHDGDGDLHGCPGADRQAHRAADTGQCRGIEAGIG